MFLYIALLLNLILIVLEVFVLSNIKDKTNIFKYYTFLQNFLACIISIVFVVYISLIIFFDGIILEFVRGLRYIATCGLVSTMFIYVIFLSSNKKNHLNEEDFLNNFNYKKANIILHYLCPIISLVSYVILERIIFITDSRWTIYAVIPSAAYWIIYLFFSLTNKWNEPYDFSSKNSFKEIFVIICIPILFVLISFVLWNIK